MTQLLRARNSPFPYERPPQRDYVLRSLKTVCAI